MKKIILLLVLFVVAFSFSQEKEVKVSIYKTIKVPEEISLQENLIRQAVNNPDEEVKGHKEEINLFSLRDNRLLIRVKYLSSEKRIVLLGNKKVKSFLSLQNLILKLLVYILIVVLFVTVHLFFSLFILYVLRNQDEIMKYLFKPALLIYAIAIPLISIVGFGFFAPVLFFLYLISFPLFSYILNIHGVYR